MAVHAHAHANTGAPGHIGAVVHALQRAPAALGLQRAHAVVFYPHIGKRGAQWRFQIGGGPVVGQATRLARNAAANIGRGQLNQPVGHDKRPARHHAYCRQVSHGHTGTGAALRHHANDLVG